MKRKQTYKKSILAVSLLTALNLPNTAIATSADVENIERISVTGTRSSVSIDDALSSQIIITRADIDIAQPISITDLLSSVAGIDVTNQGGKGQNSSIFMRGTNNDHTLILIDGNRVSSATSGTASLNVISPEMIERIEIVKGPRAALWGSDAIGGVIQIFTRQLQGGEHFAGATIGDDGYQQLKAGVGFSHGSGYTSLSINKEKSDGFDVKEGTETDNDGYDFLSVAIRGQQNISEQLNIDWLLSNDQGDNEYDGYYNGSEIDNHTMQLRARYNTQVAGIDNETVVAIGQTQNQLDSLSNGVSQGIFETVRNQVSVVNHTVISPTLQVNTGVDHYQEEINSGTDYDVDSRDITGVFVHGLYSQEKISLEATVRHDDVDAIDSEVTYNLGAGYNLSSDARVVFSYGTGFKAPTFNDLYYPGSGNPELNSEYSDSFEVFTEVNLSDTDIGLSVYQSEIDDLIAWTGSTSENFEKVEITGAELTLKYQGFGGQHEFNASYIDAEDKATGEQLIRRAKEKFNYKFNTSINAIELHGEFKFHGKRYDEVWGVGAVKLNSYQLINLGVLYSVNSNIDIQFRVNNLFDEEYQTVYSYNTPERTLHFGVTYNNF